VDARRQENNLVFGSERDGLAEIYIMNAGGSGATRLADSAGENYKPAVSGDGERIAFSTNRDGNYEIDVMNIDGTSSLRLTNTPDDEVELSWPERWNSAPPAARAFTPTTRLGNLFRERSHFVLAMPHTLW
jgi:Tol biopolymer transport system component